jgi:hypothetical protein
MPLSSAAKADDLSHYRCIDLKLQPHAAFRGQNIVQIN